MFGREWIGPLFGAAIICAVAVGLWVAPASGGGNNPMRVAAKPKPVEGTMSLQVSPRRVRPTTGSLSARGTVYAGRCSGSRTVRFAYFNPFTGVTTSQTTTVLTSSIGQFFANVPRPSDTGPARLVLVATVDFTQRTVGSKNKGKKGKKGKRRWRLNCLQVNGSSAQILVDAPAP